MPRHCSVFGCKTNYDSRQDRLSTFSLPKNEDLRQQWLNKIPTDLSKLKNPVICIKHFEESDIIRIDRVMYKGELKEYPRLRPKLKENALPRIFLNKRKFKECPRLRPKLKENAFPRSFPNTPKYFTTTKPNVQPLADVEDANFKESICQSLLDHQAYVKRDRFDSLGAIEKYVATVKTRGSEQQWSCLKTDFSLCLCLTSLQGSSGKSLNPIIKGHININKNWKFSVYVSGAKISLVRLPVNCQNIKSQNSLHSLMNFLENVDVSFQNETKFDSAVTMLKETEEYSQSEKLQFLVEQLLLRKLKKSPSL